MEFTRKAGSHQKSFVTHSGCKFDVQRWPYRSTVYFDMVEVFSHKSIYSCSFMWKYAAKKIRERNNCCSGDDMFTFK